MEQTNLFIALGGLLIFALMLASAVRRYQELMAERRMRIKRIIRGVDLIKDLFERINGCPLPAELAKALHQDVLTRLQKVRQIEARFQGIDELITEAEQVVLQMVETKRFEIWDKPHRQKITHALGEMIGFLQGGGMLTPLTGEQLREFIELAGTRRAECVYRYHLEQAKKLQQAEQLHDALGHCDSIKAFLNEHGPASDQVKAWYAEAEDLSKVLSEASGSSVPAA